MRLQELVRRLAGAPHWGRADVSECREAARLIQSYLDGQTSVAERTRVQQHLELCRRCGLEARTYAEIKAALARRCGPVDELSLLRLRQFEQFVDRETASRWDIFGRAVAGPLKGERLPAIVHVDTFWFAWAAFVPATRLVS